MFERFRKKKVVQVVEPDEMNYHMIPEAIAKKWIALGHKAKTEIAEYIKQFDRVDLMRFQDSKQFDDTPCADAVYEATNNEEWQRDYPMGEQEYNDRIPEIVIETVIDMEFYKEIKDYNKLVEKINGMQKKIDKIETLISNAEFKLCGKDAMKL